jgi:opacity protein-like surface antigen
MTRLSILQASAAALAVAFAAAVAQPTIAMTTTTFYGITVHVSSQNIKVQDPKTKQTLSFVLVPKFDQVFSADGKTTYQMSKIKAGQYVGVIYDTSALGIRHADKIYLLTNANQKIGTQ